MIRSIFAGLLLAAGMTTVMAGEGRDAIHANAMEAQPLMPGMKAPAFTVRTADDQPFSFDPEAMEAPVVISFFRGGWCPYCNLHLSEMRKAEQELKELGFEVWFMSADKPGVLVESLDEPDIGYTLFSDAKLDATRQFGLAFSMPEEDVIRYREQHGIDLEAASGETHHALPVPATFIIAKDGTVNFAYANPTYHVRLHPDVLLAAARAYARDEDSRLRRARQAQREKESG